MKKIFFLLLITIIFSCKEDEKVDPNYCEICDVYIYSYKAKGYTSWGLPGSGQYCGEDIKKIKKEKNGSTAGLQEGYEYRVDCNKKM